MGKGVTGPSDVPPEVQNQAAMLARYLRSKGISPQEAQIAIGGVSGSGKSTLAQALAQELGMRHRNLDAESLSDDVRSKQLAPGTIGEHTNIFHGRRPDASIFLSPAQSVVEKQLQGRGVGALNARYLDLEAKNKELEDVFALSGGTRRELAPGMHVAIRPENIPNAAPTMPMNYGNLLKDVATVAAPAVIGGLAGHLLRRK